MGLSSYIHNIQRLEVDIVWGWVGMVLSALRSLPSAISYI